MKRLSIMVMSIVILFSLAYAHDGAISLYTDETATDCDANLNIFQSDTVYVLYIRDNGPQLGRALQFRLLSSTASLNVISEAWRPDMILTIGNVFSGISLTATDCLGAQQDNVYIGMVAFLNVGDTDTFTVRVVDDPNAAPDPGIFITLCETGDPMYRVLGGTFVYNGSCNPGVEATSWGAIKSMYK